MPYFLSSLIRTGGVRSTKTLGPPDILAYCYRSRMVFVVPAETYDQAIDLAQESFPELRGVERGRIRLEVRVVLSGNPPGRRQSAEIGRSAWPAVVAALTRFEVVEIQLADPDGMPSGHRSSVAAPPPYESGAVSNMKVSATNLFESGAQIPSLQSQSHLQSQSLTNRLARLLSRSSRGHHLA